MLNTKLSKIEQILNWFFDPPRLKDEDVDRTGDADGFWMFGIRDEGVGTGQNNSEMHI